VLYDWLQNISFAHPLFLLLFAVVPLMIYWYTTKSTQATMMVSSLRNFSGVKSWRNTFRHLPFILRILAIISLILGLARPQIRNDEQITNGEGIDIVLCLDISGSMLAQDFSPNRMEAAKNVAADFINSRPTDRIGLVIFSGESFTMCPLTTDRSVLKTQLFSVESGLLEDGTAIGSGLATSVERLRASQSKSKVIILLTDGENNGGLIDPNTAKEIAKSVGVRVYTVGVGTEGFAPMPVQTAGGIVMQREKVSIDEKLLTQIANETGGKYFRARDNESLSSIYKEIDQLEKSKIEVTSLRKFSEQFFPFALAALILVLMEFILRFTVFRKFP
jgi:Ca-activated chloride channel homolog